jgi:hypothetical protein
MRRSLLQVMCVVVLLCICWVVIHPAVDVEPTVFRYAVFAALTLFLLRSAFKYAHSDLVSALAVSAGPLQRDGSLRGGLPSIVCAPLRC